MRLQIAASGRFSSLEKSILRTVPVFSGCPLESVILYSPVVPAILPRGSIKNFVRVGKVAILICIPVETTPVAALGWLMLMVKEPEAVKVGGFLSWSQLIVIFVPKSKVAWDKKSPSILILTTGVLLSNVTLPVLLKA